MNLKIKHLILAIISLVLLTVTLYIPMPARDSEQMKEIKFGYPLAFVSQNFVDYDTFSFFPRYLKFEPFNHSIENIYWLNLLVSFLSIFIAIELIVFILEFVSFGIRKKSIVKLLKIKNIRNKGFTLIEILVVIAIIGILASVILVSLNRSRIKTNTAVLKSAISSLRPALSLCCSRTVNITNAVVNPAANTEICSVAVKSFFPVATGLKATGVTYTSADCDGSSPQPFIDITVTGHSNTNCNGPAIIRVTENGIIFPAGC